MGKSFWTILILAILVFCVAPSNGFSQIDPETEAKRELNRRNLNEQELRNRLDAKGVDVDNLSNLSAAEAIEVQKIIEETVNEMERENQQKSATPPNSSSVAPQQNEDPVKVEQRIVEALDTQKLEKPSALPGEIYGQHLFLDKSLKVYNQGSDIKPGEDYILGPNDEITVSIWGLSRMEEAMTISKEGYVTPERMPRIFLKGFSLGQARDILKQRYSRYYRFRKNEFDVAIKYSRVINVNIFGEVNHYGGFTLPAINTAFNALVAAGGPTNLGSVRKIKVIRGRDVRLIDVYAYMMNPRSKPDYYLQENDIIQVPVADFVIDVRGMVNRPFRYELLEGEGLMDAIRFAGGLKQNALKSRIKILRYVDDRQVMIDANYGDLEFKKSDVPLISGDIIIVDSIAVAQRNVVKVSGAVDYEGEYDLNTSNKLSELLPKIGLNRYSRKDLSFVKRKNADDTYSFDRVSLVDILNDKDDYVLSPSDEIIIFALSEFVDQTYFVVEGAVRRPDTFPYNYQDRITFTDALSLAGGLEEGALSYAYITRLDSLDVTKRQYIQVGIEQAKQNADQDIEIMPKDMIFVGTVLDENHKRFIDVSGAVVRPGRYEFGESMTLKDALLLAGGMSFNAASNRVDIFRMVIEQNQPTKTVVATVDLDRNLNSNSQPGMELFPFDQIVVREVPEFEFQQNVEITGQVKYPGIYSLTGDNERLHSVVERAGGLTNEAFAAGATLFRSMDSIGYVVVDLEQAMRKPGSRNDVLLKEGDIIEIPKQIDLVRIIGYTNASELYPDNILTDENGIAVPFFPGKNAKYYIDEFAAGVAESGDVRTITVEHANGQIVSVRNYGLFRSYPEVKKGSIIRVGQKKESRRDKEKKEEREDIDWGKIFANSVAQATTILSLILLLQRID